MQPIRVVVAGATGRTGSEATRAILGAEDLRLVGAVARRLVGQDIGQVLGLSSAGVTISNDLEGVLDSQPVDVLVDFTGPSVSGRFALAAAERDVHPVVGTTGLDKDEINQLDTLCRARSLGAVVVPNFSLGATVLMRLVTEAARVFSEVEIVEGHHRAKLDAPSGTALRLREKISQVINGEIPIHSLRLSGIVAEHDVIFSAPGETLVLRHDAVSRQAFAPGVLLAVRKVSRLKEVVYDLERLFDL